MDVADLLEKCTKTGDFVFSEMFSPSSFVSFRLAAFPHGIHEEEHEDGGFLAVSLKATRGPLQKWARGNAIFVEVSDSATLFQKFQTVGGEICWTDDEVYLRGAGVAVIKLVPIIDLKKAKAITIRAELKPLKAQEFFLSKAIPEKDVAVGGDVSEDADHVLLGDASARSDARDVFRREPATVTRIYTAATMYAAAATMYATAAMYAAATA